LLNTSMLNTSLLNDPTSELTDTDHAAVAKIIGQADGLAAGILSAAAPDADAHRALHGLAALGTGSGLFVPSTRHTAALARLPAPAPRGRCDRLLPPLPVV
jgi:hypothetical protein